MEIPKAKMEITQAKMRMEKICRRFITSVKIDKITALGRGCNGILILMIVLWQAHVVIGGDAPMTKPHCRSKCGELNIPYPFGLIGDREDCYLSAYHFGLTCDNTTDPPKTYWNSFIQVIDIRWESSEVIFFTNLSTTSQCYSTDGLSYTNIRRAWIADDNIRFSYTKNVFTAIGCDTYAYLQSYSRFFYTAGFNYTTGCMSICENNESVLEGSCSGMGCCQTSLPPGFNYFIPYLRSDNNHSGILDFNPCSYAFLVEKNSYTFNISDLKNMDKQRQFPIVMDWSVGNQTCEVARKNSNYLCMSKNSYCLNSTSGYGYICKCHSGYQGNPYLENGCQDIDECKYPGYYSCNGTCVNIPGSYNCTCPVGTIGDAKTYGCIPVPVPGNSQIRLVIILPVVVLSLLGAIALSVYIYAQIQRRKLIELRHMYFLQNGGAILEKQISARNGMEKIFKVFTMDEMEKATHKFDECRILGRGGQGIVYKGTFSGDNSTYAIKKSLSLDGSKVEDFINEMIILSQINHRNVVKLVGCCLEEENPLLVYEFVPNGTLFQHIHNRSTIPWDVRLKIGAETAGALGYLHSAVNTPIIHGDVKSSNVLLQDNYTAKVSDFGASRLIPVDETQFNTVVQGTLGYLDPEYIQTHELTEKSDVYSFGVVLVELLTGKTPISSGREGEPKTLATYFLSCMGDGSIRQILDDRVAIEGNLVGEMMEVASIAKQCLNLRGEDRPSMMEVSMELQRLRREESHPWDLQNVEMATQEILVHPLGRSVDIDPNMQISDEISLLSLTKSGR